MNTGDHHPSAEDAHQVLRYLALKAKGLSGADIERLLREARQRAVVVLRYHEDLTERETADVLGVAIGTVKSQHRDAIARLRTLVPDLVDEVPTPSAGGRTPHPGLA